MEFKYSLFWDPNGPEVKENILNRREEIIKRCFDEEKKMWDNSLLGGWNQEECERNFKRISDHFDDVNKIENMSNHKPYYRLLGKDIDLTEALSKITHNPNEQLMYILLDYNGIIDYKIVNKDYGNSFATSSNAEIKNNINSILSSNSNTVSDVIIAHNHPNTIAAIPSKLDLQNAYRSVFVVEHFAKHLADFIILTDCDLYSQRQYDDAQSDNKNTLFYRTERYDDFKSEITSQLFEKRST